MKTAMPATSTAAASSDRSGAEALRMLFQHPTSPPASHERAMVVAASPMKRQPGGSSP